MTAVADVDTAGAAGAGGESSTWRERIAQLLMISTRGRRKGLVSVSASACRSAVDVRAEEGGRDAVEETVVVVVACNSGESVSDRR